MEYKITTHNESETELLAQNFESEKFPNMVICLNGDLGSGKTVFAKGFALSLGIDEVITSPTFTIMNDYKSGRLPLYHFDMYRLNGKEEASNLGFDEYFDLRKLDGVVVCEWAENVEGLLPKLHVEIEFEKIDENKRKIRIGVKGWVK